MTNRELAPGTLRTLILVPGITVVCSLPLWLTGALSVQIRGELGFGLAGLGGAVALFRVAGAVGSFPLGRLADRIGPIRALRAAVLGAALSCIGIALHARSWTMLVLWLALCGAASVFAHTAANLALVRMVPDGRQGLAFGVKQAAMPIGSLLAGLAVPLVALTLGWRWAFAFAGILCLLLSLVIPSGSIRSFSDLPAAENRIYGGRSVILLGAGIFFAMSAAASATTFLVESAASAGISPGAAGLALALGSACSILSRLTAGYLADRRGRAHLRSVARMQMLGAVGFLILAQGHPASIFIGAGVVFAFGWGFNGLFWFAIARMNRATPGRATGLIMPGGLLGGVFGPLAFGWIVEAYSYSTGWLVAAIWGAMASCLILVGRAALRKDLRAAPAVD